MVDKKIVSIVLAIVISAFIFLSPLSFSGLFFSISGIQAQCMCSDSCLVNCNSLGFPSGYYYWGGISMYGSGIVSKLSIGGLFTNTVVWGILMVLIYWFIYKK